jgi:hypothetical protein
MSLPPIPAGGYSALAAPESATSAVPRRRRMWPAIAALFFFAAFIPESGVTASSSPLRMIVEPLTLPYIVAFYGSANVLIREALVRGRRGWASLILFGLAFGIVNEGVIAGTWYHVANTGYGFIGGVDIAWAVALTVFHAAFSVAAPIALVGVLFPLRAGQPWLGRWGFVGCWALFGLLTLGGVATRDAQGFRAIALLGAIVLTIIALLLPPAGPHSIDARPAPSLRRVRWASFGLGVLHNLLILVAPAVVLRLVGQMAVAQAIDITLYLAGWTAIVVVIRRWTQHADWDDPHTVALLTGGMLSSIILLSIAPPTVVLFEPLFSLGFLILLIWTARYSKRMTAHSGTIAPASFEGIAP